MTPQELREIGSTLGKGWQTKLANLMPCNVRTVRRWIGGKKPIRPLVAERVKQVINQEREDKMNKLTKKIEKLTAAQEKRMQQVIKEWLEIGRSTQAIDRKEAEKSICALYERIGKEKPVFFWMPSPLQCMLGLAVTKIMLKDKDDNLGANLGDNLRANLGANLGANLRDNLRANLRANLWDNLGDNLRDNLRANLWDNLRANLGDNLGDNLRANLGANLRANLWANLWDNLGDNLRDNLGANLWANLRDNLWANLWDNLGDNLRDNLRANLWANLRANLWANLRDNLWANLRANLGDNLEWDYFASALWGAWEVFYDFCNEIGVPYSNQDRHDLDLWLNQSRHCHLWWPMEKVVFISERPASLSVDNRGRLHCENDAALYYHDGYALYHWHGIRVPKWVIERPEKITIESIDAEKNAEVRRVMCERYGWERYFKDGMTNGKVKLLDTKNVWGQPVRLFCDDSDGVRKGFVHVINGTVEPDGNRHEFIINCKIIEDDAEKSVYGTYPELLDQIHQWYPGQEMKILRQSLRT